MNFLNLRKGTWGYFYRKKIFQLIMCLLCVVAIFAFCIIGYFATGSTQNLFTVVAVLSALPLGNFLVVYIALFPYKQRSKEEYDALKGMLSNGTLLTELAITSSTEPTLAVDYAYIHAKEIVLLSLDAGNKKNEKKKIDIQKETTYIEGILAANMLQVHVHIFTEYKAFEKRILGLEKTEMTEAEKDCILPISECLLSIAI